VTQHLARSKSIQVRCPRPLSCIEGGGGGVRGVKRGGVWGAKEGVRIAAPFIFFLFFLFFFIFFLVNFYLSINNPATSTHRFLFDNLNSLLL
jgi:hypothetical protein